MSYTTDNLHERLLSLAQTAAKDIVVEKRVLFIETSKEEKILRNEIDSINKMIKSVEDQQDHMKAVLDRFYMRREQLEDNMIGLTGYNNKFQAVLVKDKNKEINKQKDLISKLKDKKRLFKSDLIRAQKNLVLLKKIQNEMDLNTSIEDKNSIFKSYIKEKK